MKYNDFIKFEETLKPLLCSYLKCFNHKGEFSPLMYLNWIVFKWEIMFKIIKTYMCISEYKLIHSYWRKVRKYRKTEKKLFIIPLPRGNHY